MRDALRHTAFLSCRAAVVLFLLSCVLCSSNNSTTDVPATPVPSDAAEKGTPIAFQAEISKMLDILINSLYTKRAVFLRELISNGSDALDKIRVLYLTNPMEPLNDMGESPEMSISIRVNTTTNQIIVRDGGIGMTKSDMVDHLGSLGSSGTKRFFERLQAAQASGGDGAATGSNKLIGQFGVGFYSAFLVGDRVRVASKSDESDTQYVWESTGNGEYFIYPDPRGNTLGRGTEITIDVKADAREFVDAYKIKSTVHEYSEFIGFPIYLEEMVSAPKTTKTRPHSPGNDTNFNGTVIEPDNSSDVSEGLSDETASMELRRVRINKNRPIWTRPMSELSEEDYSSFYTSFFSDYQKPLYYSHFHVEGEIEMDSILFIPSRVEENIFTDDAAVEHNMKLYVQRVFITDDFHSLLPTYLNFVKGVIDSNDLPLNVSREVLQESRILRIIKKKIVRKALTMFSDIAERDQEIIRTQETGNESSTTATSPGTKHLTTVTYPTFWQLYGKHIRRGIVEDSSNRGRLSKLLRYYSTRNQTELTSLQSYVDRMPENQRSIFFLTGESVAALEQSPLLDDAREQGVEVLYMTDPIDEFVITHISTFEGKKMINLADDSGALLDETAVSRAIYNKRRERYLVFLRWLRDLFGRDNVHRVLLTKRRVQGAFLLSHQAGHVSARFAKILREQTLGSDAKMPSASRVLEVNYRHPLVQEMYHRTAVNPDDEVAKDIAWALFDTANLQAEFPIHNLTEYVRRIYRLLHVSVDIDADAGLLPADDDDYTTSEKEQEDAQKYINMRNDGVHFVEDDMLDPRNESAETAATESQPSATSEEADAPTSLEAEEEAEGGSGTAETAAADPMPQENVNANAENDDDDDEEDL